MGGELFTRTFTGGLGLGVGIEDDSSDFKRSLDLLVVREPLFAIFLKCRGIVFARTVQIFNCS